MEFIEELVGSLRKECLKSSAKLISLSGGIDSSILAYFLKEKNPKAISVTASEFIASDLTYCQLVASKLGIPLTLEHVEINRMLDGIEETIKILKNFNDIEIRNQLTAYFAIKWAKSNGFEQIITGDGADEIFAGYAFLLEKSDEDLDKERKRIQRVMDFPSKKIGSALGVNVETPFLTQEILDIANKIPSSLLVREENGKRIGKWILRKAFENVLPRSIVWRKKTPMQDGSGTAGLTEFFDKIISDETFLEKYKAIKKNDSVEIRTKESLYYYETFRKFYEIIESKKGRKCRYCSSEILEGNRFCKMCGAYPV